MDMCLMLSQLQGDQSYPEGLLLKVRLSKFTADSFLPSLFLRFSKDPAHILGHILWWFQLFTLLLLISKISKIFFFIALENEQHFLNKVPTSGLKYRKAMTDNEPVGHTNKNKTNIFFTIKCWQVCSSSLSVLMS